MSNKRATPTPTPNGPSKGASIAPGNAKTHSDMLKKMLELTSTITEYIKDEAGKQDYEQLQETVQQKTQEAKEAKRETEDLRRKLESDKTKLQEDLAEAKRFNEQLHKSHRDNLLSWSKDTENKVAELKNLSGVKAELEHVLNELNIAKEQNESLGNEVVQLEQTNATSKSRIKELELDRTKKKVKLEEKKMELDKCRDTLQDLSNDLGFIPFDMDTINEFNTLALELHNLVWNTFATDLPLDALSKRVSGTMTSSIPQLATNSRAARCMRCAVAEAIIAERLSTHIFHDTCLVGDPDKRELDPLVAAMGRLTATGHPVQATIIRCQLVKVNEKTDTERKIASRASERVCEILRPWLGNDNNNFNRELYACFLKAIKLWQTVQRTRMSAESIVSLEYEQWEAVEGSCQRQRYNDVERPDEDPRSSVESELSDPGLTAVLFPQICIVNNMSRTEEFSSLIFHGYALFSTQLTVIAAKTERSQRRKSISPDMRRLSQPDRQERGHAEPPRSPTRQRRLSIASQQRSGLGIRSDSSAVSSVMGPADPTASVSSTRSRRSGSGVGGGG